ncbi:MAG: hypothetical protein H6815_13730 [Phycisphaeraceae bacterium]|nr:hypothetical protein [Phycisphaerales bacterium]MCB9861500.1 hypothetical protein [Phycisphaeraceae bacterium]
MARCGNCGSVLFGGIKENGARYCNKGCRDIACAIDTVDQQFGDEVLEKVLDVHSGPCPKCGKPGPIDVHTSHFVWSAIYITRYTSTPAVCCTSCGRKAKLTSALGSALVGWWGIPFGILITPVYVGANIVGLFKSPDPEVPSEQLTHMVKLQIASNIVHQVQEAA